MPSMNVQPQRQRALSFNAMQNRVYFQTKVVKYFVLNVLYFVCMFNKQYLLGSFFSFSELIPVLFFH